VPIQPAPTPLVRISQFCFPFLISEIFSALRVWQRS
jgi:hypothetical protein